MPPEGTLYTQGMSTASREMIVPGALVGLGFVEIPGTPNKLIEKGHLESLVVESLIAELKSAKFDNFNILGRVGYNSSLHISYGNSGISNITPEDIYCASHEKLCLTSENTLSAIASSLSSLVSKYNIPIASTGKSDDSVNPEDSEKYYTKRELSKRRFNENMAKVDNALNVCEAYASKIHAMLSPGVIEPSSEDDSGRFGSADSEVYFLLTKPFVPTKGPDGKLSGLDSMLESHQFVIYLLEPKNKTQTTSRF